MDAQRWRRLRPLLDEALDLPRDARAAFVAGLRPEDFSLREELVALLAQQQRTDAGLDGGNAAQLVAPAIAATLANDAEDQARIGRRIGPFKLVQLLGHGGMGAVYLGQRVDGQFLQKVAIKLVRGAVGSPGARERFAHERQVLAQLVHPNIAQLLDGGDTDDGLQYFTMEYIDGVPITEYCSRYVPTVDGRLRLLVKVAAALAFAHASLVIHRDIKPGNILVTPDRRVKLLDFGIAKLIGERGTTLTRHEYGPMTPEYAAPEQFRGGAVTVATDVYQFGVLMFRVLSGRLPYQADPQDPLGWARAVTEQEPLTLGRALTLDGAPREASALQAGWPDEANLPRLRRALSGDIEAVVRKALAKQPAERYASMDALLTDLENILAGRPVSAQRANAMYFARRFVGRHRVAVAGAATMAIALIALSVTALQQAASARREATRATQEAEHARSAVAFVGELFEVADPNVSGGKPMTARGLLDHGAQQLDLDASTPVAVRGRLGIVIGNGYLAVGAMPAAMKRFEQAIAALRDTPDVDPLLLATALERGAAAAIRTGQVPRAIAWLGEVDALLQRTTPGPELRYEILVDRLAIARDRGDYPAALDFAQRALAQAVAISGTTPDYRTARAHLRVGTVLSDMGRHDAARVEMDRGRALVASLYGEDDLRTIGADAAIGWMLSATGEFDEAERRLDRAGARYLAEFGPRSGVYATNLYNRGILYRARGEYARSRDTFFEVADIYGETSGAQSVERGWALSNAGAAMLNLKDFDGAQRIFGEVEAAWRANMPDDTPVWQELQYNQAMAALGAGRVDDASTLIEALVVTLEQAGAARATDLAQALAVRADVHAHRNDTAGARADLTRALALLRDVDPARPELVATLEKQLAGIAGQ
jgi:eukaryotic-like serine/threonine-protein kinase